MKKTLTALVLSLPLAFSCTSTERNIHECRTNEEAPIIGYRVRETGDSFSIEFQTGEIYKLKIKDYERALEELRDKTLYTHADNLIYFINCSDKEFPKDMSDEERLKAYPSALLTLKILDRNQDRKIDDKDKIMIIMSPARTSVLEHLKSTSNRFSKLRFSGE